MRALVVSNMLPDAAHPERGRFVRDQVAALRALDGLEVELLRVPPRRPRAAARRRPAPATLAPRAAAAPRFDIVHAHFGLTAWPALAVPARVRALTVHGTDLRHPRTRIATAAVLPLIDLLAAVSERARAGTARPGRARGARRCCPAAWTSSASVRSPARGRAPSWASTPRRPLPAVRRRPRARREALRPRARARARRRRPAARRSAASSPSACRCGSTRPTPCSCPPSARASAWPCWRRSPATCPCSPRPWASTPMPSRRRRHAVRAVRARALARRARAAPARATTPASQGRASALRFSAHAMAARVAACLATRARAIRYTASG